MYQMPVYRYITQLLCQQSWLQTVLKLWIGWFMNNKLNRNQIHTGFCLPVICHCIYAIYGLWWPALADIHIYTLKDWTSPTNLQYGRLPLETIDGMSGCHGEPDFSFWKPLLCSSQSMLRKPKLSYPIGKVLTACLVLSGTEINTWAICFLPMIPCTPWSLDGQFLRPGLLFKTYLALHVSFSR